MKLTGKLLLALLLFLNVNYSFAQNINKSNFKLSHPLSPSGNVKVNKSLNTSVGDTITVVAIMIQFQEDNSGLTTGNGKFDLSNKYFNPNTQRDTVIDSPPYDSSYFADHLLFLKNYYYKASKGKLVLNTQLIGNVFNLPKQMQEYSPQKFENFLKMGELFKDTWARVDSVVNFSNYNPDKTAFVIFHSGVGRDIDLASVIGFDPTPYDLPSIFMSLNLLKQLYGNNYNGYQTSEGFIIKNSLIIPSTELRELDLISGKALIEIGMNGVLVGNFGSFLGLPDLFDTKTGKTAIGRFGLMDGQSIFSYNGMFPPEPSAWEKIYLGWVQPVEIYSGTGNFKLNTSSLPYPQDSTILKVSMNNSEYFLLENRIRSPFNNGQRVYTRNRGFKDSTLYTKDVDGFIFYDISKIEGNVTDVSYLDWSLPGVINDTANFKGGILIWHIDETVINANISSNTINNNFSRKGVSLKEAKGAQEIGVTISTPFGDVIGDGFFVDFWYDGNHYVPSTIYKNEFTPNSIPNTLSHSGANNGIYITSFSQINERMSFNVSFNNGSINLISGYPKFIPNTLTVDGNPFFYSPVCFDINNDGKDEIFVNSSAGLYGFRNNGSPILANPNGLILSNAGHRPPAFAFAPALSPTTRVVSTLSNGIALLGFDDNLNLVDSQLDTFPSLTFSSNVLVFDSSKVIVGFNNKVYSKSLITSNPSQFIDSISGASLLSKYGNYSYIKSTTLFSKVLSGNIIFNNTIDSLRISSNNNISDYFINGTPFPNKYGFRLSDSSLVTLADIDRDGRQDIMFVSEGKVYALDYNGVIKEYFPAKINGYVKSGISVADVNNDGLYEAIFVTDAGDLYAYSSNGKVVSGYPVKTTPTTSTPALFNYNDTLGIVIFNKNGITSNNFYAYKTNVRYDDTKILWRNVFGDKYLSNSNFKLASNTVSYSELLPSEKTYNWPNPVYNDVTYIRYYLNGFASSVSIKILDLSGELVTTFPGTNFPKTDNEVPWNVSSVQSGVYYGLIEAESNGIKEKRIIKIAVVK